MTTLLDRRRVPAFWSGILFYLVWLLAYYVCMNSGLHGSPDCPLCPGNNLLKTPIIAENNEGYVLGAYQSPGNYLIIPKTHVESLDALPDTWWRTVKDLLPRIPDQPASYNLSCNIGQPAGQTAKHIHFWVIPRDASQSAAGRGLASLIDPRSSS